MRDSPVGERVRDGFGKGLIALGIVATAVAVLVGALQIDVISSAGRFFPCGAVFRPSLVLPEAAAVCADALASQLEWLIVTGAIAAFAMLAGVLLRASVPKRLQHRR